MNWGHKIFILIALFLTGLAAMVYISMQENIQLIDENYYEKELQFQAQIDAAQRFNSKYSDNFILLRNDSLILKFETGTFENMENFKADFICINNSKLDFTILDKQTNNQKIILTGFAKNNTYTLRVSWINNGLRFYTEKSI